MAPDIIKATLLTLSGGNYVMAWWRSNWGVQVDQGAVDRRCESIFTQRPALDLQQGETALTLLPYCGAGEFHPKRDTREQRHPRYVKETTVCPSWAWA